MSSSACDTLAQLCVRCVLCWPAFPLVSALRSTGSAADRQVHELQRLGKKTLEAEILKEALEHATGSKKQLRLPPSRPKDGSR